MKLTTQVIFRDMVPLPSLEEEIRRRVAKLDVWSRDLTSCHVVVEAEANRHHQGHLYQVKLKVRLPDAELTAGESQRDADIHRAMHASFDAMGRQIEDHVRRRRRQTKLHAQPPHERIEVPAEGGDARVAGEPGDDVRADRG